jgi:hypothetical protein
MGATSRTHTSASHTSRATSALWPRLTGEECLDLLANLRGGADEKHQSS